jgi:predicted ribosome quality control (RQC) complex YloA/Tae2 family protein
LTELRLRLLLEQTRPGTPLWRVLVQGLQGLSPTLAREIVHRATGSALTGSDELKRFRPVLETVAHFVAMIQTAGWEPCGLVDSEGRWLAFSSYPLLHRTDGQLEMVESISFAAERFYGQQLAAGDDAYGVARQQVDTSIQRAVRRLNRRQKAMQREQRSWHEIEQLRLCGEWILASTTQIASGQMELRLPEGSGVDGNLVQLNPTQTPADNAATYFKRYRKAKRATESAGERLAGVALELAYLDQLSTDLMLAANRNEIDAVRVALQEAGYGPPSQAPLGASPEQSQPHRYMSQEGYPILVGRNSAQNEKITFQVAGPKDLWLHARGWPGAHVIIRSGGHPVSDETLDQAATLAARHSKARNEAWVDVLIAERRRVRRAPGKRPGMVMVDEERVLRVRPGEAVGQVP